MRYFNTTCWISANASTGETSRLMHLATFKTLLVGATLSLLAVGCVQQPEPLVIVEPSYAYTRDAEALAAIESWPAVALGRDITPLPELVLVETRKDEPTMTDVAFGPELP
jgi:hypothetical protein